MPSTFQAVAAFLIAILPGALTVWGYERVSGRWSMGLSDRILRFLGISAVLHALAAPATYLIWHEYLRTGARDPNEKLPLGFWPIVVLYVAVPLAIGTLFALGIKQKLPLAKALIGDDPAPTAWDYLFHDETRGWVRLRLKTGTWLGGAFAEGSYVAGYPEPADIYVSQAADIDTETGEFKRDAQGKPVLTENGFLVRWEEVEFLVFTTRKDDGSDGGAGTGEERVPREPRPRDEDRSAS